LAPILPPFTSEGLLSAGDHPLTLKQLDESFLVTGIGISHREGQWDVEHRRWLVENLSMLVKQLWTVAISQIFIAGSFVEDRDHPNDIDGYFECDRHAVITGELQRSLNLVDPHKVWTWDPYDRRPARGHWKKELPMWHRYRIDLYPEYGQFSGIVDRTRSRPLRFSEAFRLTKDTQQPKGIVNIRREP